MMEVRGARDQTPDADRFGSANGWPRVHALPPIELSNSGVRVDTSGRCDRCCSPRHSAQASACTAPGALNPGHARSRSTVQLRRSSTRKREQALQRE